MSIWKEFKLYIQQVSRGLLNLSLYYFSSLPSRLPPAAHVSLSFLSLDLGPLLLLIRFLVITFKHRNMEISARSVKNLRNINIIVQSYNFPKLQRWLIIYI